MKRILQSLLVPFFCLCFQSCFKEEVIFDPDPNKDLELNLILRLNNKECSLDNGSDAFRYSLANAIVSDFSPYVEFSDIAQVYFNSRLLENKKVNDFGEIEINKEYSLCIITEGSTRNFTLTFTNLPIVQIVTTDRILNEPKTLARIYVNYPQPEKATLTSYIGLEERGASAQFNPKKSLGFSFLNSCYTNDVTTHQLFDMQNATNWILDAMYIDKSRMRNKVSFELWNRFDGENHFGIKSQFVELYLNHEHIGLYCLNEAITSEFLQLKNDDAVLYKAIGWGNGATTFEAYNNSVPSYKIWDDWEQKYPEPRYRLNWEPLKSLREMVVDKPDQEFIASIGSMVNEDIFIDYFILLNIIDGADNNGKNNFLVKSSAQHPLQIIPWDMDLTWGFSWPGVHSGYTAIVSNNLFNRLITLNPDNFKGRLKTRWFYLRNHAFTNNDIKNIFNSSMDEINRSGVIQIENKRWNESIQLQEEHDYMVNWMENRLVFLDDYFNNL